MRRYLAALLVLAACDGPTGSGGPPVVPDVTASVERLGNPFAVQPGYGRNVWDMQVFGGRVYVGHGDSGDNLGPIPVWSIDAATGAPAEELLTAEEQVDAFRVLGGALYVPGHDPRDDWTLGNFYRLDGAGWTKVRTIPHGLHTFDLAERGGRLFAALGTEGTPGQPSLVASSDGGGTWEPVTDVSTRFYDFLPLDGTLYAIPLLRRDADPEKGVPHRFDGVRFVPTAATGDALLPGLPSGAAGRMVRAVSFGGALLYVSAAGSFDWKPAALALTRDMGSAQAVPLPDAAAVPYDLLVRGGTLYVLAAAPSPAGGSTIHVYAADPGIRFSELFRFRAETFARSFEEAGGDFFFGLGSHLAAPSSATGDLLRVRRASYAR
jgi:hypothetical protein